MKIRALLASASIILITDAALASELSITKGSIEGAGRNIMRTASGGLVATYAESSGGQSSLIFDRSLNNGRSWEKAIVETRPGQIVESSIDSNFQGSYIAFTEEQGGKVVGRIAFSNAPFSKDPKFSVSLPVTPAGVEPWDTSIQASRKGWGSQDSDDRETIAYGWQDKRSKSLYIGVSKDGRSFPPARIVVADRYATSGPAVAVRGKFVIATYLTTNPNIVPTDVPHENGVSYPAWIETFDGGESWSSPQPLFGSKAADFPTVEVDDNRDRVRLAGGTAQMNSPILNWAFSREGDASDDEAEDKTAPSQESSSNNSKPPADNDQGGITFVQTSLRGLGLGGRSSEISVVSFRQIAPGANWTHVIANNKLSRSPGSRGGDISTISAVASQFQYSALIDTPVRATVYKEYDSVVGETRFVAAISTDTGKRFDRHASFGKEELTALGIENVDATTVFAASQCLFEDRNGDVFVDVMLLDGNSTHYARLPLGVNAQELRISSKRS
ncbi:hypothetical protein [Rhizobium leguminosarum]|uniref:hypothetical protein n=1 Tax=Rhizobium leguminosarum TaxID=384 RepID=UPI0010398036|nr:hypothetical protein [Rhizobium leguminosarum]TBZ73813.1 hypothetical protein E0H61_28295 [Rhizobium leguminosarum bv. viciae]